MDDIKEVKAKFYCDSVLKNAYYETPKFLAKYSDTKEDNSFSSSTPVANMEMNITNTAVHGFFKPGKSYYLTITEAPE